MTASSRLPPVSGVVAFAACAALLASAAPLLAYAGSLALFGLPHVLAELRYVDGRFGRRLRRGSGVVVVAILGVVVLLRGLALAGTIDPSTEYGIELLLVAGLAFVVVPDLAASPARAALAIGLGTTIALGSALAPGTTIVVLALLHNATPVGFLADRFAGDAARPRVLAACAVLFVGVPTLVASGALPSLLAGAGLRATELGAASAGPLASHLRVFVPAPLVASSAATDLFAAAAFLQLLHYGIVIGVLPRLLEARGSAGDATVLPWPRARVLVAAIGAVGAVATLGFVRDFGGTRATYGLVASVHAWIELPVLLLAFAPRPTTRTVPA